VRRRDLIYGQFNSFNTDEGFTDLALDSQRLAPLDGVRTLGNQFGRLDQDYLTVARPDGQPVYAPSNEAAGHAINTFDVK